MTSLSDDQRDRLRRAWDALHALTKAPDGSVFVPKSLHDELKALADELGAPPAIVEMLARVEAMGPHQCRFTWAANNAWTNTGPPDDARCVCGTSYLEWKLMNRRN